jgi:hypothetical protein
VAEQRSRGIAGRILSAICFVIPLLLASWWAVAGGPSDPEVQKKGGTVIKDDQITIKDEELKLPDHVFFENGILRVASLVFTPPTRWKFELFPGTNTHVDIHNTPPDGLTKMRQKDTPFEIQVFTFGLPTNAGQWPIRCEGNSRPPEPGKGELPHWSAKTNKILVDLSIDSDNNNRYEDPDENQKEENLEDKQPKIIMQNLDDDDGGISAGRRLQVL